MHWDWVTIVSSKDLYMIDTGQENMPSIMIPDIVANGITYFSITTLDVNEVKSIYGHDGFGQAQPSPAGKFSQTINQFDKGLSSTIKNYPTNTNPFQSSTSGTVRVDTNEVLLSDNKTSPSLSISGSISTSDNGYVDLMITDQQHGNIMWNSKVVPNSSGNFSQKVAITKEFHSGQYDVTASYNGSSLGTTLFNVINEATTPEFGSIVPFVFLIPIVFVIIFSKTNTRKYSM